MVNHNDKQLDDLTPMSSIRTYSKFLLNSFLLLTVLVAGIANAANITVKASRNPVSVDDSFHIIYEADSTVDDDPDFSPIYVNFDVLSSSQSTNMRSINGNWSLKKTWDLTVIAKDIGKITIPPISFGKDSSPAIRITVTNSSSANNALPGSQGTIPAKIYLESSVDKNSGWVQSQFLYTIRLFRTVRISGASIADPETDDPDSIIQPLGEDNYQTTRNGIRYEVIERRYAIFPQKSGKLRVKPAIFQGRIQATQPRSIFDQFSMSGQMKRLRSKAIDLDVKPAPANINLQDWLPASNIMLYEEWSADLQTLKVGEPVTRTITITAEGVAAVQLPDIDLGDIEGLKQYPDKAVEENRQSPDVGITGLKQIKVALIPARAGQFTLPEIRLNWWNTRTGQSEVATLPETTLTVVGTASTSQPAPAQPITPEEYTPAITTPAEQTAASADNTPVEVTEDESTFWKGLSLLLAFAWLITVLLYIKKTGTQPQLTQTNNKRPSLKSVNAVVEKAARKNDAHATRAALIDWARLFYEDESITNLLQITAHCSSQLAETIRQLNQALYRGDGTKWSGQILIQAFRAEKSVTDNTGKLRKNRALKPLYNRDL